MASYDNIHSFHWNSDLSIDEKEALIKWVKGLDKASQIMLEYLLEDATEHGYEDGAQECR